MRLNSINQGVEMLEAGRQETSDKMGVIREATCRLAEALGLKLTNGARLRIAEEPFSHSSNDEDRALQRLVVAKAWANVLQKRDDLFGVELVGSPMWTLLIDLYINESRSRPVYISEAASAARVPSTTALRCIAVLEGRGYIYKFNDPCDKRRVYLRLTRLSIEKIEEILDRVAEGDAKLGLAPITLAK